MLLSVKPVYAAGIVSGEKTVELRRTRPNIDPGQLVAIYSSSPTRAVIGACRIARLDGGTPPEVKARYLAPAKITDLAFDDYFDNAREAWALHLERSVFFEEPIPLSRLRQSPGAEPVQSWRFLAWDFFAELLTSRRDLAALRGLAGSANA